jgi:hypothetical protein
VNKHLNKINLEVSDLESQFHDGVYLIMLMGLLEGFFVPLYSFHATPRDFDQKVHNVSFAFELMEEVGLKKPKARPEGYFWSSTSKFKVILQSCFRCCQYGPKVYTESAL